MAVILIAIGLLFLGIDLHGVSGIVYPEFHVSGSVGKYELSPSIQAYTTKNILGDQLRIDYLPDVVGCIFLLVGICMLIRYNRRFLMGIPFTAAVGVLSVLLRTSGFLVQGPELVVWIVLIYFALAVCELLAEYFVIYSTVSVTNVLANRASNTRMLFGWWITVICRVFITFLVFVGHVGVSKWYQGALIAATLFYLYHLIGARKYVGMSDPSENRKRKKGFM